MKKMIVVFVAIFSIILNGCKKAADTPVVTVPERLEMSPTTASVRQGNTISYTLKYFNNLGEEKPVPTGVAWSSDNAAIATVNQQGVVTGIAAGQTTIKAQLNNATATALVTVTAATVPEQLIITSSSSTLIAGTGRTLTLTYFNNQGVQAPVPAGVVWSTSSAATATVDQQGLVTGVAAGTATITATLNTVVANFVITVTNSLERLEISPGSATLVVGYTTAFTLTYYNPAGVQSPLPSGVTWVSNNTSIAIVNTVGMVTAVSVGQTSVRASLNATIFASASITVTASSPLATITLNPTTELEVNRSQSSTVTATGRDAGGNVINGLTFSWASSDPSLVSVNSSGQVTGVAYGTTNVTASSSSITSPPLMVQVIRSGNFNGAHNSTGSAKLKIVNGVLRLETSSNFSVSGGAPDLRIYLSNNTNSINGAVEVATLNQRSGAQSWAVPATNSAGQPVTITSYPFVLVWCKQFGGNYGHVVLP